MKKVLHVGCGQATLDDLPLGFRDGSWQEVRFDVSANVQADIIGTIQSMEAVETASMDALYSAHNIEHVFEHEVPKVLSEFKRVIKRDGFCVIACPDVEEVAKSIVENGIGAPLYQSPSGPISPIDVLYGHGQSISIGQEYMAHKTGFGLKTLAKFLDDAGFDQFTGRRFRDVWELRFIALNMAVSKAELQVMFDQFALRSEYS